MFELTVTCKCVNCDKSFNSEDIWYKCQDCWEEQNKESIKQAIRKIYSEKHWEDTEESFVGFKNDSDKDIFLRGVKYGIEHAFFWMAEHVGEVKLLEGIIND